MILDLENPTPQDRYVPDVIGYNFSVLMPDPYAPTKVRSAPKTRLAGLGRLQAVITYCQEHPPDAATQQMIAARGDSISLIPCGYSTGGSADLSYHTATPAEIAAENPNYYGSTAPAPTYQPPTGIEDCAALGLATAAGQACVQRNTQRTVDAENAFLGANESYETQLCISQGGGGWVPVGEDVAQWCAAEYGGSGAASVQTKPNQSVPPSTPITTIPSLPSSTPTKQVLTSAYASGSAPSPAAGGILAGLDSKTLLLAAAGIAVLVLAVKR